MAFTAPTFAPASVEELASAMRSAYDSDAAMGFSGGGTEAGFGYPAERVDVALSLERLRGIADYAPDDMTVTVLAGTPLADVQRAVAERDQRLALDAPLPERATVGGLAATNGFGPLRTRYGTLRDLVLGATFVLADGASVRGGGKVVKNVAGFDLPKLFVGSLGTLGCIASLTFRLHPKPHSRAAVSARCPNAEAVRALCAALEAERLEPSAVVALAGAGYALRVLFEGFAAGVDEQTQTCLRSASALGIESACDADDAAFAQRHDRARTEGSLRLKLTFSPAEFAAIDAAAIAPLRSAFSHCDVVVYPTVGVAFVAAGDLFAGDAVDAALLAARSEVEARGGSLVLLEAPAELRARVDVFGTLPASIELMRALKARFDPKRLCNRGRFVGHL